MRVFDLRKCKNRCVDAMTTLRDYGMHALFMVFFFLHRKSKVEASHATKSHTKKFFVLVQVQVDNKKVFL